MYPFFSNLHRVLTPPPTSTVTPIVESVYDSDGCLIAVEWPNQPIPSPQSRPTTAPAVNIVTTPRVDAITNLQRYLKTKIGQVKDHVLDRMVMFYLPSAPTRTPMTTTTMRTTTTTTTTSKPTSSLSCPKPNGIFPYLGDCGKFINCWKGRPHVQSCAPGTLFNSIIGNCDHANKVDCQGKRLFNFRLVFRSNA